MTIKTKIKEVPGFQFVADNMEFMSAAGRRRMMEQQWISNPDDLQREKVVVSAMLNTLSLADASQAVNTLRHQLMQLHDLHTTIQSLQSHIVLDEVELFELKNLSYIANIARQALDQLNLLALFPVPDVQEVFHILDPDNTGIPNFYIYDSYDNRLAPLRKQLKQAEESEKAALIDLQNQYQHQVIDRLCDMLHPYAAKLSEVLETMAYIDFVMARAYLSKQWDLRPSRDYEGRYFIKGLFNPRLRLHNEEVGLRYQPIDIDLTEGVTLVTGANMAGKTVLLKSVGLAQIMYQFGFPVPAADCCLPCFDDVVFCIGDEQNEMNGLSSFAAEITRISDVVGRSQSEHLMVLVDEPARTTNPVEGKALVQALASLMHKRDSLTMITTHYGNLGISCRRLRVRGFVENMVDIPLTAQNINRFIDYSLIPDDSDEVPHEAIKIAEMLSCHPDLIASAKLFLQDA